MMTTVELYTAIVNGSAITDEMIEKAQALLDADSREKSARAAKRADRVATEYAPLIDACVQYLGDGAAHTASEIAATLGVSTSKATVIAKSVPNVVIGTTKVKGRSVKTYSL